VGVAVSKERTEYAAKKNLLLFFDRHEYVFYWTFTFPGDDRVKDKDEAERRFKPFKDLVNRRKGCKGVKGEMLYFWERQKDGTWHVHLVTNLYLSVRWLRPWMMERGWGWQMRVEEITAPQRHVDGVGWVRDDREQERLIRYLLKYLTKAMRDPDASAVCETKKKLVGCSASARNCTTSFRFTELWNPCAKLYYHGVRVWRELGGHSCFARPSVEQLNYVFRLGRAMLRLDGTPIKLDARWDYLIPDL